MRLAEDCFYPELFFQASFWLMLYAIDQKIAKKFQSKPCQRCGSNLHKNNFPRKPRGIPLEFEVHFSSRFSFSCGRCDKRATPPSARFLGRKVYISLFVVLIPYLVLTNLNTANFFSKLINLPPNTFSPVTLKRWLRWWDNVPYSRIWKKIRGNLGPNMDNLALPLFLIEQFQIQEVDPSLIMMAMLGFLSPMAVPIDFLSTIYFIPGEIDDS